MHAGITMLFVCLDAQIDVDGSGYIDATELGKALETVGIKLPGFEVRDLVKKHDTKVRDGKMDIEEFKDVRIKHYWSNVKCN